MTEMIAVEPALAGRLLRRFADPASEAALLAAEVRTAAERGEPIVVTGCGTSEHAGLAVVEILIDALRDAASVPPPRVRPGVRAWHSGHRRRGSCIAVTHDGGTAATNAAIEASRAGGARIAVITGERPLAGRATGRHRRPHARDRRELVSYRRLPLAHPRGRRGRGPPDRQAPGPHDGRAAARGRQRPDRSGRGGRSGDRIHATGGRGRLGRGPPGRPRTDAQDRGGLVAAVGLPRSRDVPPRAHAVDRRRDRADSHPRRSRGTHGATRPGAARSSRQPASSACEPLRSRRATSRPSSTATSPRRVACSSTTRPSFLRRSPRCSGRLRHSSCSPNGSRVRGVRTRTSSAATTPATVTPPPPPGRGAASRVAPRRGRALRRGRLASGARKRPPGRPTRRIVASRTHFGSFRASGARFRRPAGSACRLRASDARDRPGRAPNVSHAHARDHLDASLRERCPRPRTGVQMLAGRARPGIGRPNWPDSGRRVGHVCLGVSALAKSRALDPPPRSSGEHMDRLLRGRPVRPASDQADELAADEVDHLEVPGQEVLEHQALDASRGEPTNHLPRLVR